MNEWECRRAEGSTKPPPDSRKATRQSTEVLVAPCPSHHLRGEVGGRHGWRMNEGMLKMDGAYICSSSFTCCKGSVLKKVPRSCRVCPRAPVFSFSPAFHCLSILTPAGMRNKVSSARHLWICVRMWEFMCVCMYESDWESVWMCDSPSLFFALPPVPAHSELRSQHWQHALLYSLVLSSLFKPSPYLFSALPLCHSEPSFFSDQSKSLLLFMSSHHTSHSSIPSPPSVSLSLSPVVVWSVKQLNLPHASLKRQMRQREREERGEEEGGGKRRDERERERRDTRWDEERERRDRERESRGERRARRERVTSEREKEQRERRERRREREEERVDERVRRERKERVLIYTLYHKHKHTCHINVIICEHNKILITVCGTSNTCHNPPRLETLKVSKVLNKGWKDQSLLYFIVSTNSGWCQIFIEMPLFKLTNLIPEFEFELKQQTGCQTAFKC